ncbi:MAG: TIGR03564 family F420-dependent LLM class oxidoreductase [Chloroflexota bacterium]|nr:TIGR03564 family F420-dependent LLM class oxidoreductase [Chloroflexota bacterium]
MEEKMSGTVGIACMAADAPSALANIERAEQLGIRAAWLTAGGLTSDSLTLFAAAAVRTRRILLGTSIAQTWTRHPLLMAVQAATVAALAPGRFRLGIGPSHGPQMEPTWGIPYEKPLAHLRDYLAVLRPALQRGEVHVENRRYRVHAVLPKAPGVPVLISALREKSFRLAGELTDGAITWVTPITFVQQRAVPAIAEGARAAGRPTPPIIFHAPVCLTDRPQEARAAARQQLALYPRLPNYAAMFRAAGYEPENDSWTDAMIDAVVISGDETTVANRLRALFAQGVSEVIVHPIGAPSDPAGSTERAWQLVASLQ